MFNYRVENLEQLLEDLKEEGVEVVGEIEEYEYGKFGWIIPKERKLSYGSPMMRRMRIWRMKVGIRAVNSHIFMLWL